MDDLDIRLDEYARPRLWNPNAAGAWSLLLSPAFGSILHGLNWKTLGEPGKARANFAWAAVSFAFLGIGVGTMFLPDSKALEAGMRIAGFAILIGWFMSVGRSQVAYVSERFGDDYERRSWGMPMLLGFGGLIAFVGAVFALAFATFQATPEDIAKEVRPQILAEWRKNPQLIDASIERIDLNSPDGKTFDGIVLANIGGRPTRLALHVVVEGAMMNWTVNPIDP